MTFEKPRFSRKLLAIPYGLFLLIFVVLPLFIIAYYAFTDANGSFTFNNLIEFFVQLLWTLHFGADIFPILDFLNIYRRIVTTIFFNRQEPH